MKKVCLSIAVVLTILAIGYVSYGLVKSKTYKPQNPVAVIEIEGYEKPVKVELDPKNAPNAVANFIKLSNSGFYNNYKMNIEKNHIAALKTNSNAKLSQIVENPQEDYVYGIKGDFLANGYENLLKIKKGVIVMQRNEYGYFGYTEEGYNSANSQFFIATEELKECDGQYAGFGKVVEGMDVIDAISASRVEVSTENSTQDQQTENGDSNQNNITIKSIKVDTFGVDYGVPEYSNYETIYNAVNEICKNYFGTEYDNLF